MDSGLDGKEKHVKQDFVVRVAAFALLAATIAGCVGVSIPREWQPLLDEIRSFEQRIGFRDPDAYIEFSEEGGKYPFCGKVSRLYLPYSYEDPEIHWDDAQTEKECRADADGADVYFGMVEAVGEVGAAITTELLSVKLHRFIYLIIHEDCHDQYELPYGIEEALCNLIAYKGMAEFSEDKYGAESREHVSIRRYANVESRRTRAVKALYEELAGHYARFGRKEIPVEALLKERARILGRAERALAWKRGSLNNVGIANEMTYSRHYPMLEGVYDALGQDLRKTVAFFKWVDESKVAPARFMKERGIKDAESIEFIRAYEAEVVRTIERLLAETLRQ